MMDDINWDIIRPIEGDQKAGFEELVCQIARKEKKENYIRFIQLGLKDGGLECYWELDDGKIIGWQAKYFTSTFSGSQWSQIKDSVKKASETYGEKLDTMIIAVPYKPTHAMQEKADEKTLKWQDEFENCPEIEYWWAGDLNNFLSQEKYDGFRKFWFNELQFPSNWFKDHTQNAIENLGDKYDRKVNIKTNNQIYFDSIYRNDSFRQFIYQNIGQDIFLLKDQLKKLKLFLEKSNLDFKLVDNCLVLANKIKEIILSFKFEDDFENKFEGFEDFNFNEIFNVIDNIERLIYEIDSLFSDSTIKKEVHQFTNEIIYILEEFYDNLSDKREFIEISNNPTLLFYGEAGIGKSFLFGDVAYNKINDGKDVLLLLGEHFESFNSPENIILDLLGIKDYNFDEFLEALECRAYMKKSRIVILIDGINEGRGIKLWNKYFKSLINKVNKKKSLSFVFSIRSTFLDIDNKYPSTKLQVSTVEDKLTLIKMEDFGNNYDARIEYFKEWNIPFPNNYMLNPRLNNPLFLKIFCKTVSNQNLDVNTNNLDGLTQIMESYLDMVNEKLAEKFEYHPHVNLVKRVLIELIEFKFKNQHLSIEEANKIVMGCISDYSFKHKFLKGLIDEKIINEHIFIDKSYVSINFQRFEDYISIKYLITNTSFDELIKNLNDSIESGLNPHLLEMFSIYIPDNYDVELYSLLNDDLKSNSNVMSSFIESLKWRKNSFDKNILDYINKFILKDNSATLKFLELLITLAPVENNFFNAYSTHNYLINYNLGDIDGFWTLALDRIYQTRENVINHLLKFAFLDDYTYYTAESIKLASIMITWFLSTTNKKLRDKSTQALVNLLKNRLDILKEILILFNDVKDPFILERLYAAAYGCVLSSNDLEGLCSLSNHVYESIFNQELIYPHMLVRDYARNIIEFSIQKNCEFEENIELVKGKIRPPYNSNFPEIPSDDKIENYKTDHIANKRIFRSMAVEYDKSGKNLLYGDFGRYVFQSDFAFWKNGLSKDNIHVYDLMKIAISKIFEMGYDEQKHGNFDEGIIQKYGNSTERIGKKYQWIALYELLAQVSDKYPIMDHDYISGHDPVEFDGPWQGHMRNIDPTINCFTNPAEIEDLSFEELYASDNFDDETWLKNPNNLINPLDMLTCDFEYKNEEFKGVILKGFFTFTKQNDFGEGEYPKKEIWYDINGYVIKNNHKFQKLIKILKHKHLSYLEFPEMPRNDQIFNKEYGQSYVFDHIHQREDDGETKFSIDGEEYELINSTSFYSGSEKTVICNNNYLKLNGNIFERLDLQYGDYNSFCYTPDGNIACFDSMEIKNSNENNMIIDKDLLLNYLKENDLNILYIIRGEKRIVNNLYDAKSEEISGISYFKNGHLKYDVTQYFECDFGFGLSYLVGSLEKNSEIKYGSHESIFYMDNLNNVGYMFVKFDSTEFISLDTLSNIQFENIYWDIYDFNENNVDGIYMTRLDELGLTGDGKICLTEYDGVYLAIYVNSSFDKTVSLNSKLFQKFIKPLLFNILFF